jgi:hypothetical protein
MKMTPSTFACDAKTLAKGFDMTKAVEAGVDIASAMGRMGFTVDSAIFDDSKYMGILKSYAQDAALSLGEGNIPALGQFFQFWFTDTVRALYRGRSAKQVYGVDQVGDWTTEQVVQPKLELTGDMALYDDFSRPPLTSYNLGWATRDTVRLEVGVEVTKLEEARAAGMRQNAYQLKKEATILKNDIFTNKVFWNGFEGRTFGILQEVGTTNAMSIRLGSDLGTGDEVATVEHMQDEFAGWIQRLTNNLAGNFDPTRDAVVFNLPLAWQSDMTKTTSYGWSISDWLKKQYPNVEIRYSVELNGATNGEDTAIVYAPMVDGVGKKTVSLLQTSALRLIGAVPTQKGMQECYSSSVAGVLVSCPAAILAFENKEKTTAGA